MNGLFILINYKVRKLTNVCGVYVRLFFFLQTQKIKGREKLAIGVGRKIILILQFYAIIEKERKIFIYFFP